MAPLKRILPRLRPALRIAAALAVVAGTVAVVGVGPFLRGLTSISPATILVAVALAAVATAAAAWRWRIVSMGFGLTLGWSEALTSYYRSQFLNMVLPGGVVGDVHRAYVQGRQHERVDLAARAVAAERVAGQLVQIVLTLAILLPLGLASRLTPVAWISGAIAGLAIAVVGLVAATGRGRAVLRREYRMLRPVLVRPSALIAIAAASVVVVAAHAATFVVAGLAAGVHAGADELAVVALIVLGAAALPVNVGGWGPREAVAASAFALAGLGAGAGVAVSTAFGVLTVVAVLPGSFALLADRFRTLSAGGIIGGRRSA
ncbi:lysylphosphatidylglycerol synthase domain-containing protein [Microbacterium trichothecenolyticum]